MIRRPPRSTLFPYHDALPISVTGSKRDPALPQVPTMQEAGVAGYEMYVWFGFVAPAAVAAPGAARLSDMVDRKSTRLNSSPHNNSYALLCLKKIISSLITVIT